MSRKRNRSVRTLPLNTVLPQFPSPAKSPVNNRSPCKQVQDSSSCFGEPVKKSPSTYALYYEKLYSRNNENIDSILNGVKNLSCKSSSSSISWGDDYESESCWKVQNELEKVEKILCGSEPVPSQYDENEFKEWLEMFPDLRILKKDVTYYGEKESEDIGITSWDQQNCDDPTLKDDTFDRNVFRSTMVDILYENVANRLMSKSDTVKQNCKSSKVNSTKLKLRSTEKMKMPVTNIEVDNYLKVSPIPQKKYNVKSDWDHDNFLSSSLINSDVSSAKWMKPDSPEYNSLPYLTEQLSIKSTHKSRLTRKRNYPKSSSKDPLVLPPIESPKISARVRSISAIPRKQNQCLSAFSVKLDKELVGSRFDFSKYFNRNTPVKIRTTSRIPRAYKRWDSIDD